MEGGLDQPEELQPEPGDLRLVGPRDDWSHTDWEKAAAVVLRKGKRLGDDDPDSDVWRVLTRTTYDGIAVAPLGTPDDLDGLATSGRPTRIGPVGRPHRELRRQRRSPRRPGARRELALGRHGRPRRGARRSRARPRAGRPGARHARALPRPWWSSRPERGVALHPHTNLGADPVGARVRDEEPTDSTVAIVRLALEHGVGAIVVDATAVHDLGASDAQEVGYSLAAGAAYLRLLTEAGLAVDDAVGVLEFRFAATDEQFPTIAKLRAARRCWARVLELSGVRGPDPAPARRDEPADAERLRPVGQHAARHGRGLRRGGRRSRRSHRRAVRQPARRPRRVRAPDRAQRLLAADRGVPRRRGHRPRRWGVRRGEAHRRPRRRRLGRAPAHRGRRRRGRRARRRLAARAGSPRSLRDATDDVATRQAADDRAQRVPEPDETLPTRAGEGDGVRRYGAAFEALRAEPAVGRRCSWRRSARWRPTPHGPASPATCWPPVASPSTSAGATDGVDDVVAAYAGQTVVCLAGTDASYAEWGTRGGGGAPDQGCDPGDRGRQGRPSGPTTRVPWASTRSTS